MSKFQKTNAGRIGHTTEVLELEKPPELPEQEPEGETPVVAHSNGKLMDGGHDPREMALKRWGVDWHHIPVDEGNVLLGDLKEEFERAAKIMQQRQQASLLVICACGCKRELLPGQACMSRTLRDDRTLLPYNIYFATQECVRQQNKKQYGMAELIK